MSAPRTPASRAPRGTVEELRSRSRLVLLFVTLLATTFVYLLLEQEQLLAAENRLLAEVALTATELEQVLRLEQAARWAPGADTRSAARSRLAAVLPALETRGQRVETITRVLGSPALASSTLAMRVRLDELLHAVAGSTRTGAMSAPPEQVAASLEAAMRAITVSVEERAAARRARMRRLGWIALAGLVLTLIGFAALVLQPITQRMADERSSLASDRDEAHRQAEELKGRNRAAAARSRQMLSMLEDLERQADALALAEERFRRAVEAAPNAMVMTDREGRIVLVNAEAERVFGYEPAALLGESIERLVPPTVRARHPELRRAFFAHPEVRSMGAGRDLHGVRADGSEVPVEIGLNPIQTSEGVFILSSIIDISERKRAERAIRRYADDLERSNDDLQQFAYVASHDLREPLRMIVSFLELLVEGHADRLDDEAREYIGFAVDGAQRLQQLIDGLLTYSRVGCTDAEEPVALGPVIDEILRDLRVAIDEAGAVVEVGASFPTVRYDRTELRQVLQNLIGNALKFHGEAPPRVHIATEQADDHWVLSVRDTGIGLDPKFADRIFGVFQRLHTAEEYAGTGIGLSIAKKIVERRGGRIWVESAPGDGATFSFTIPAHPGGGT